MKLRLQRIISFILIMILTFYVNVNVGVQAEESSNDIADKIELLIDDVPKVDIKLAVGDTDIDIDQFKVDLYAELESRRVDISSFDIVTTEQKTVSTEMADAADIFNNWGRIGWPGQWSYDASTKTITNAENTDNFTGFYYPHSFNYRNIDFSYMNCTTDLDDDVMGAMVRFNVNADGTVTTYFFSLDRGDYNSGVSQTQGGGGLYKIVQKPFEAGYVELLQPVDTVWTRYNWTQYRILANGNNIQVYQDSNKIIDYTDNNDPIEEGSYGFFSFSQAYSMYKDITVTTENTMTFMEVLQNTEWEEDSLHFLINLNDSEEEFLTDATMRAEVTSELQENNIHYIGWGSSTLEEETETYVGENSNRGTFIDSSNYEESILQIADYVIWRTTFSEGSGIEDDPFIIHNSGQIRSIKYNLSGYYRLEEDVDFDYDVFEGIGTDEAPFTGDFDGNGYWIQNCMISDGVSGTEVDIDTDYSGFFRVINNAKIKNVNITGVDVTGANYVGGLVGHASGSATYIENCYVGEISISGYQYVGGIVGWLEYGTVVDCESFASIYGSCHIGGAIGYAKGAILKNILSLANVTGKQNIGGITGTSEASRIEQCESFANVNGNQYVGGITGYHNGVQIEGVNIEPKIIKCDSLANLKGNDYVGGIAGYAEYTSLENCYSQGTIEGNVYLGGLIGADNEVTLTECQDKAQIMIP